MKYITVAVLTLQAGAALGLTEAQAATRSHALTPFAGRRGWYHTTEPVQFKVGEEFLFDGEMPKNLAELTISEQMAKAAAQAKATAKAEAKAKAAAEAEAAQAEAKAKEEADAATAAEAEAAALAAAAGKPAAKQD